MWRRRSEPVDSTLVVEAAAFLDGSYAEHLTGLGRPVPPWAWTNLLAHGDKAALRQAARRPATRGWGEARKFLAGEVVDLVDSGRITLERLQHLALVPLELELAGLPPEVRWGPGQLVAIVIAVLPQQRAEPRS